MGKLCFQSKDCYNESWLVLHQRFPAPRASPSATWARGKAPLPWSFNSVNPRGPLLEKAAQPALPEGHKPMSTCNHTSSFYSFLPPSCYYYLLPDIAYPLQGTSSFLFLLFQLWSSLLLDFNAHKKLKILSHVSLMTLPGRWSIPPLSGCEKN